MSDTRHCQQSSSKFEEKLRCKMTFVRYQKTGTTICLMMSYGGFDSRIFVNFFETFAASCMLVGCGMWTSVERDCIILYFVVVVVVAAVWQEMKL